MSLLALLGALAWRAWEVGKPTVQAAAILLFCLLIWRVMGKVL